MVLVVYKNKKCSKEELQNLQNKEQVLLYLNNNVILTDICNKYNLNTKDYDIIDSQFTFVNKINEGIYTNNNERLIRKESITYKFKVVLVSKETNETKKCNIWYTCSQKNKVGLLKDFFNTTFTTISLTDPGVK